MRDYRDASLTQRLVETRLLGMPVSVEQGTDRRAGEHVGDCLERGSRPACMTPVDQDDSIIANGGQDVGVRPMNNGRAIRETNDLEPGCLRPDGTTDRQREH